MRIFCRAKSQPEDAYDLTEHLQRWEARAKKSGFYTYLEAIPGSAGEHRKGRQLGAWRAYQAFGKRKTADHPYHLIVGVLHSQEHKRVLTISLMVHRDFYMAHQAMLMAVVQSFGPFEEPPAGETSGKPTANPDAKAR